VSVFKDKRNQRWRYSFMWQGKRYNGSCPKQANNERNAERLERLRQEELVAGKKRASMTVEKLAVDFFEYQTGRVAPLTFETQQSHIELHVLPIIGKRRLDEIDKHTLDTLSTNWLKEAEPTTVNVRMGTLLRMLALAVDWDHIAAVPKWKSVTVPDDTPRFLTADEATLLLKAARGIWRTMILVGLRTGLRVGELRGLQWGDVDLVGRTIRVRRTDPGRPDLDSNAPKGKRDRTVPLSPDAHIVLRDLKPENAKARDWVWPAVFYKGEQEQRDRCRSESGCKHGLRAAVEAAGLVETSNDRIGWHTLRHTFASWLVIRGVSLRVVQDLLGHAHITQTERYAHLAPDATHHDEVARLDPSIVAGSQPLLPSGDPE
jgi:integrase